MIPIQYNNKLQENVYLKQESSDQNHVIPKDSSSTNSLNSVNNFKNKNSSSEKTSKIVDKILKTIAIIAPFILGAVIIGTLISISFILKIGFVNKTLKNIRKTTSNVINNVFQGHKTIISSFFKTVSKYAVKDVIKPLIKK